MIKKEDLDKRICDTEEGTKNTQTWREWIIEGEKGLELRSISLDDATEKQLNEYIEWLDYLDEK